MSGVTYIGNAAQMAALIASAIQSGITGSAPILYDPVQYVESTVVSCTGSNQIIFAANNNRRGLIVKNTHGLNKLRINFGSGVSDTNSIVLEPGESFTMGAHNRSVAAFNVKGTSGTTFVAVEITT